jgi:hypothetical protein
MLSSDERLQITKALSQWAEWAPDEPMVGFLGRSRLLSPRELVEQVFENTPDGKALLEILEHGVRREGINQVVARLSRREGQEGASRLRY